MWPSPAVPPSPDKRITPGLDRIRFLVRAWPVDLRRLRTVLITGTNGKGSTAAFLYQILTHLGYRVGLYTSPHLHDVHERIRLPAGPIAETRLQQLWHHLEQLIRAYAAAHPDQPVPTFFECITACALKAFEQADLDLAILEVGLGGRWDATNVVDPRISVITNIDYDHQEYLGHDLAAIAREKFGITRPDRWLVCGEPRPDIRSLLRTWSQASGVRWWHPVDCGPVWTACRSGGAYRLAIADPRFQLPPVRLGLEGAHQVQNALLAVITARLVCEMDGRTWRPDAVARALQATRWPGRLEWLQADHHVPVLLDGAHNPAGVRALCRYLDERWDLPRPNLMFGCLRDKPWTEMLQLLRPRVERLVLVPVPGTERSWSLADRSAAARQFQGRLGNLEELGLNPPSRPTWWLVTGSLYLVGQARSLLLQRGYAAAGVPLRNTGKTPIITVEKIHE